MNIIEFGQCSIDTTTREVVVDHVPQKLRPKSFDLLLFLILNRYRAITRHEILTELWIPGEGSDSNITRLIIELRRSLAGSSGGPECITTIPRVGYRFVAPVAFKGQRLSDFGARSTGAASRVALHTRRRVAILPWVDQTNEQDLAWIQLGAMAVMAKQLNMIAAVEVLAPETVLKALELLQIKGSASKQAEQLRKYLHTDCVLGCLVKRDSGALSVTLTLYGKLGQADEWTHSFDDATQLAMATTLSAQRMLTSSVTVHFNYFESKDPFANLTFAKAMQAATCDDFKVAADFLRVVADIEPDNIAIKVELGMALARCADPDTLALLQPILSNGRLAGDPILEANAERALGTYYTKLNDPQPARYHSLRSIAVGKDRLPTDVMLSMLQLLAGTALFAGEIDACGEHLDQALRLVHPDRDEFWLGGIHLIYGPYAWWKGRPLERLAHTREAARINKKMGLTRRYTSSISEVAAGYLDIGDIEEADRRVQEATLLTHEIKFPEYVLANVLQRLEVSFFRRREDEIPAEFFDRPEFASQPILEIANTARGHLALATGRYSDAIGFFEDAIEYYHERQAHLRMTEICPYLLEAAIRNRNGDVMGRIHRLVEAQNSLAYRTDVAAACRRAGAARCLLKADIEGAVHELQTATRASDQGMWRQHCAVDLTWLYIVQEDYETAQAMLATTGHWGRTYRPALFCHSVLNTFCPKRPEAADPGLLSAIDAMSGDWLQMLSDARVSGNIRRLITTLA